jgi:hypothetical protein
VEVGGTARGVFSSMHYGNCDKVPKEKNLHTC